MDHHDPPKHPTKNDASDLWVHGTQQRTHVESEAVPKVEAVADALGVARAGLSPPNKDEAPRLAGAESFRYRSKADTSIVADLDGQRKAFLTLRAQFAMAGYALLEVSDGSLLAMRWNLCRLLADAKAVFRFLRQIGGAV